MGLLKNKVAVITGGSSGIGQAIAKKFDQEEAKIAIFGRNQKRLEETANSLKKGIYYRGDVRQISYLDTLYKTTVEKFGKIDILVANAGIAEVKIVHEVDEIFFDETVNTNYKGVYFTVQRALPFLNEGASIILISSVAGHLGVPGLTVYASAKAAVSHLAKTFSADLIHQKIRVNAISPGYVDTPMFEEMKASEPERIDQLKEGIPAKRFSHPDEIAEVALFLASSKSSYMVGEDLVIDGGMKAIYGRQ